MLLRHHRVVYQSTAVCETVVPDTFRGFLVQQTRWKKSWIRESLIACTFFWRKNPIAALATYVSNIFPLVAPFIIFRAMIWRPVAARRRPVDVRDRPLRDGRHVLAVLRLAAQEAATGGPASRSCSCTRPC